jgi:hypothetical protein
MASGRPLNYTTTIPVHQSVAECQSILAAAGASSVSVAFEDGQPSGLSFSLKTPHGPRNFTLPVNVEGMQRVLAKEARTGLRIHKAGVKLDGLEHATRVAWRVAKDWLEANLALVAAGMATIDEVMLPFLHIQIGGEDKVLWQHYRDQEAAALLPGSADA